MITTTYNLWRNAALTVVTDEHGEYCVLWIVIILAVVLLDGA